MRVVAGRLIDDLAGRDPFDLVADFTHWYPIEVLCALMGVPAEDVPEFNPWTVDLGLLAKYPLEPHLPRIDAALSGLRAYLAELVARHRGRPGDDFVGRLVGNEELSEDELSGALLNLLFAGHDTTRFQFGWVVRLVVEHGLWGRLRAGEVSGPAVIEEAMRLEPSLHVLLRRTLEDIEYGGFGIAAGMKIILNTYAANHDPAMFPEPARFDVARPNANRHLTFGHGGHLCLGHFLARTEMAEALALFLERFPELDLAEPAPVPGGLSVMSGADTLWLTPSTR